MKVFYFPDREKRAVELDLNILPLGVKEFVENLVEDAAIDFTSRNKEYPAREVFLMRGGGVEVTSGLATGARQQRYNILPAWKV